MWRKAPKYACKKMLPAAGGPPPAGTPATEGAGRRRLQEKVHGMPHTLMGGWQGPNATGSCAHSKGRQTVKERPQRSAASTLLEIRMHMRKGAWDSAQ